MTRRHGGVVSAATTMVAYPAGMTTRADRGGRALVAGAPGAQRGLDLGRQARFEAAGEDSGGGSWWSGAANPVRDFVLELDAHPAVSSSRSILTPSSSATADQAAMMAGRELMRFRSRSKPAGPAVRIRLLTSGLWLSQPMPAAGLQPTARGQPNGRPIGNHADWDEWKTLLKAAGSHDARVHDARHTAASLLLAQGVDQRVVMQILGHSQISMTSRYAHVLPQVMNDAADRIGKALWNSTAEPTASRTATNKRPRSRR